jgi:hypothetical protein
LVASLPSLSTEPFDIICNVGEIPLRVTLTSNPSIRGQPWTTRVLIGDFDGDQQDEAILPLLESCTGGAEYSLIFRMTPYGPQLLGSGPGLGRGISMTIEQGRLNVTEAIYRPNDARCCPTGGSRVTEYRLEGDRLVQVRR